MLLEIVNLETGYCNRSVVLGVSLKVRNGEAVLLIGPNGAGKSTLLKSVCGIVGIWKGEIRFNGKIINGSTPARNVSRGITMSPQGGHVFPDLTVADNLLVGGYQLSRSNLASRIEETLNIFPVLKDCIARDAGTLSGGEQQQLGLARALMPKPELLLVDEPSRGLAPNVVAAFFKTIRRMREQTGITIMIVEQRIKESLEICDRVYAMKTGEVVFEGAPTELIADKAKLKELFL